MYGFSFKATDENGQRAKPDILFDSYMTKGLDYTFQKVCGMIPEKNKNIINLN